MAEKKSLLTLSLPDACKQILHISDTTGITATARKIYDGDGTESPLSLSTTKLGVLTDTPTVALDINSDTIRIRTAKTPASASATGSVGTICWDTGYIYVCTATDTWERVAIAGW